MMWRVFVLLVFLFGLTKGTPIVFYADDTNTVQGDFGSRSSSTTYCSSLATSKSITSCAYTVLVASYSPTDYVANFPSQYSFPSSSPVTGPTGTPIGTWSTIISSTPTSSNVLTNSLRTAGVIPTPSPTTIFWTGSLTSGQVSSYTCSSWTSTNFLSFGSYGSFDGLTQSWVSSSQTTCSGFLAQLCMCVKQTSSPTKHPTPPTKTPTKNPTNNPTPLGQISLFSDNTAVNGNLGNRATTTSYCSSLASTLSLSGCLQTVLFASYSGSDYIGNFPNQYGFSPTTSVISATTGTLIGTWNQIVDSPTPSLSNSLYTAGVLSSSTYWWSGTRAGGAVSAFTCSQWTSTSFDNGRIGNSIATDSEWISVSAGPQSCSNLSPRVCACITSSARPTKNPTTKQPTKNPTKNPTTFQPTKYPTKNPTKNPTRNPTISPTLLTHSQLRRYQLKKGSQIQTSQGPGNYSSTPIDFLIQSGSLVPILWQNVNWTLYGATQPTISICNPVPNPIPGSITQLDQLGNIICPSVINCNSSTGPPFTSLRACVTNYTIIEDGPLTQFTNQPALLISAKLSGDEPRLPNSLIYCNSAIDREINCQFKRQDPKYVLQCQDAPIQCYQNDTIGHFFGLLEDQNPNFPYPINQSLWTEGNYLGISTILNNLTYFKNGKRVDPLNQELINSYYWTPAPNYTTQTQVLKTVWAPDVLQLQPLNWFQSTPSPDQVLNPNDCLQLNQNCKYQTFLNQTLARGPGVWLQPITTSVYPNWFNFTLPFTADGAEVYFNLSLVWQVKTKQTHYELPVTPANGTYLIRVLVPIYWDIPSAQAGPFYPFIPDPLWPYITLGPYQFPYYPLLTASQLYTNQSTPQWPYLNLSTGPIPPTIEVSISFLYKENQWQDIANLILQKNIYPPNKPLLEVQGNYTTLPTNLSSTDDQNYLYQIWASHFSRRKSSEDVDCQTFQLGGVVQRLKGVEGGCHCDPFWDKNFFCSQCLPGLGGSNCSLPYQSLYPGQPQQFFNTTQYQFTTTQSYFFYLLENQWRAPLCQNLTYQNQTYLLASNSQGVALVYTSGLNWVSFIYQEIYINGLPVSFSVLQTVPFTPVFKITGGGSGLIYCNSILGTSYYVLNPPTIIDNWWIEG